MSLLTSMWTGVSGLTAQQNAINVTAHNLANINTDGYVRQQVGMADNTYLQYGATQVNMKQVGLGVVSAETRHIRDLLLDRAYREESGRQGFYAARYEATEEVQDIFGESEGVQFQETINELWNSMNEVAKTPDSLVARSALVMSAQAFVDRANTLYKELIDYQKKINQKVTDTVDRINQLGDKIYNLNMKIIRVEAADVETAADLRDQRDMALDELGSLINIAYKEDDDGCVTVRAEGQEFVTTAGVWHMELGEVDGATEGSLYLSPVWPQLDGAPVFNLRDEITPQRNNDIGELKGYLLSRGGYVADYTDIPVKPERDDYPEGDAGTEEFRADLENYYEVEAVEYGKNVANTVVMKSQAMFDQLVNRVVTLINDILSPTETISTGNGLTVTVPEGANIFIVDDALKEILLAGVDDGTIQVDHFGNILNEGGVTVNVPAGKELKILDMEATSYGTDENLTPGTELFVRQNQKDRYTKVTGADGTEYYIYNKNDEFGDEAKYGLGNLQINEVIIDDYSYLPLKDKEENVDMKLGERLLKAWDEATGCIDPDNTTKKDITDYYGAMIGIIGNDGHMYNAIAQSQSEVILSIDEKREVKQGVTSEEELTNLIKFQNAYNASSRYVSTISEMIDTLIERVGKW